MKITFSEFEIEIYPEDDEYIRKIEPLFMETDINTGEKIENPKEQILIRGKSIFDCNGAELCNCESEKELSNELLYYLGNCICMHQKENEIIFHASGVKFGKKALLFSGISGSGKTTLSLEFSRYGEWMGDEYCHVDLEKGEAWFDNFPLHLKDGNPYIERFENAQKIPTFDKSTARSGFYIGLTDLKKTGAGIAGLFELTPICAVIFPHYDKNCKSTKIYKVEPEKYPELILSGIIGKNPQSVNLRAFLKMCAKYKIGLFEIIYSDVGEAAEEIKRISIYNI